MPVPLNPPVVVPSTSEKTFAFKFFTDFATVARSGTDGDIYIRSVPMSAEGELLQSHPTETRCNLWEAAAQIPAAATALAAVMAALPEIEAWAAAQTQPD